MTKQPRTLLDIRNEMFRIKGNLNALDRDSLFSDEDRAILVPRYTAHLKKLEEEEKLFRTRVHDPRTVTA